jgi:segregation and condensation protein B
MDEQKKIIEAAMFISSSPLSLDYLGRISGLNSLGYVKEMVESLQKDYENRGIEIVKTPQGWIMQVRQDLLDRVAHLTPYSDMSEGCKRALALVVYKEPVKQSEIIRMQGNKAYSYIKYLLKRDLIRAEKTGHTKILRLTQEFERYFGEEKEKIKEHLRGMIKEPVKPKRQEKEAEEYPKTIEDKMQKLEKMFEIPEDLRPMAEGDGPKRRNKPWEKKKGKKSGKTDEELNASHSHAFNEIE